MNTHIACSRFTVGFVALFLAAMSEHGHCQPFQRTASTNLQVRIVVPPYVRILSNVHPRTLEVRIDTPVVAEQQISVVTNEPHGFCLDLTMAAPTEDLQWGLHSIGGGGVTFTPSGDAYRVCSVRDGTYTFTVRHLFQWSPREGGGVAPWPIQAALAQY